MSNQKKENQGNERKRDAGSYRHKTRKLSIPLISRSGLGLITANILSDQWGFARSRG